jgi:hypothetical protein
MNETPFEQSRIATTRKRRRFLGVWQIGAVAAAVLVTVALGSWFMRPSDGQSGVGSSPTATPIATATPSPTPVATVASGQLDHFRVYFARDGLPPVGAHVDNAGVGATAAERIASRLSSLPGASAPTGAVNVFPRGSNAPTLNGGASAVKVTGDLATIDYVVPNGDWGVRGAAAGFALMQQIVWTAAEEPGIRRVLVTENGGRTTTIDQDRWEMPFRRENLSVYDDSSGDLRSAAGHGSTTGPVRTLTTRTSTDQLAPGVSRVVIEAQGDSSDAHPDFSVALAENDEAAKPLGAKWRLVVTVADSLDRTTSTKVIDTTPLRSLVAAPGPNGSVIYEIGLDDRRPWRTALLFNPVRIVIDLGGYNTSLLGPNAVYMPTPGATVGRTFTVSGVAHNFEANVVIRVRDSREVEVYKGSTTATNCCDPGGTFETTVTLPASVSGSVTLEVLEASARDGSDIKVIRIPLTVR